MRWLAVALAVLSLSQAAGCVEKPEFIGEPNLKIVNAPSSAFEIRDQNDGWLYFSDVVQGKDFCRFRINGKHATFNDFEIEDLEP